MSGGLSQQFCVRWNSHLGSLGAAFPQLLAGQRFVDVTLACEGHQVHCHRLVLAACSSYFESLLGENPCKHPIIILPRDIKLWEIQALVDFMYKGEVNVSQAGLPDLLKCAEILQIRGLCGSEAALNLNQIPSTSLPATANSPNDNQNKSNILKPHVTSTPNKSSSSQANISQTCSNNSVSKNSTNKTNDSQTSAIQNALIDHSPKIEATSPTTVNQNATTSNSLSIDSPMISIPLPTSNASCLSVDDCDDSLNGSTSEVYVDDPEMKLQEDYSNDGHSMVKLEPELAMANVTCEYEGSTYASGRRVRRSETLLRQAAECVSRGQTFQTVSDMFHIPISTIRFFMARKGILPRRKRGRASGTTNSDTISLHLHSGNTQNDQSRSSSPSEPPFHFAHYKLPELRPKLV